MLHLKTTDNNCSQKISSLIQGVSSRTGDAEPFSATHYSSLSRIANVPLKDLAGKNQNLLVFPYEIDKSYGRIGELPIFEMCGCAENLSEVKIKTGNLMGFVGTGSGGSAENGAVQIEIASRFSKSKNDFFLHYMLGKVFGENLFSLNYNASGGSVFDLLIFTFPLVLKNAFRQGIFKTYRIFERNDANVKGALNFSRHIRQNIPFAGKVAYKERTQVFDNPLTELVRHTIEFIKTKPFGKSVLNCDSETKSAVSQIIELTQNYSFHARQKIISENLRGTNHPFFTKWKPLQKLCLAILNHSKMNYHSGEKSVCGLLFDGAWLWEEYLNTILRQLGFIHPENKNHKGGLRMFKNDDELAFDKDYRRIYPDFYKKGEYILDAKYKPLQKNVCREDLYQVVSYMHTMKIARGGFIFPDDGRTDFENRRYNLAGYGGTLDVIGMKIPQNAENLQEFCSFMKNEEERILNYFCKIFTTFSLSR
ncbi:hypothetical protein [uncultured Treponema sp.]|uniref:5-methylcytosine restriction system specificity protein McrC n=1 Tax=uncultured Treponema sp. TaxID=162155 RepID=UPI00260B5084|nr:hypothetical protein [uncultured Treponema sp.]